MPQDPRFMNRLIPSDGCFPFHNKRMYPKNQSLNYEFLSFSEERGK